MIGIIVAGVVVLAIAAAWAYRKVCQRRVARTLPIDTNIGIAEGRYVRAGGVDQWIQIRGEDRTNPILLLAAGAGLPMEPFTTMVRPWERHFTVVFWDRRDVGRTRARNGKAGSDSWTFDQIAEDGIDIIEFVCQHLGQDKVILLGHSQGSLVALTIAGRRPDLLHAYVGTGQFGDMGRNERLSYDMALQRAREAGNRKAVSALERVPPPYRSARNWMNKVRWSMATDPEVRAWQRRVPTAALFWPAYKLGDVYRCVLGALFLPPRLFAATMACTPETLGTRFDVPVFILQGADDLHTLPAVAEEYLSAVDAPVKAFVPLPGTGHMSFLAQPELFLTELLNRVCVPR